jgi:hypothetical protein
MKNGKVAKALTDPIQVPFHSRQCYTDSNPRAMFSKTRKPR